jgi:uncharacterized protein (DUF1330 family)
MVAYVIAEVEVTDPEKYKGYMALSPGAIAANGGKFIVRGGESVLLEGGPAPKRIVVIEFPDFEAAKRFYDSPEYVQAREARVGAAHFRAIAIQGV